MTGFEEVLRDRLLGLNAHVLLVKPASYLTGYDELATSPGETQEDVTAAAPSLTGQIILTSGASGVGRHRARYRSGTALMWTWGTIPATEGRLQRS